MIPVPETVVEVGGRWAVGGGYIQAAVRANAFSGMPDGSFQPNAPVTRAQLVKVIAAAAGKSPGGTAPYTDIAADAWYKGWVSAALEARLIGRDAGFPVFTGKEFQGDRAATRAEAAVLLANLMASR